MSPEPLPLVVVSLTWREAPGRVRARLTGGDSTGVAEGLVRQGATGLVELHTCARSTWVVAGGPAPWLGALLDAHVRDRCGRAPSVRVGFDALVHLLGVSVGLDSFVQGEADIGRQVRAAFARARREGRTDPLLRAVGQGVVRLIGAGRRAGFVRANRGVGHLAVADLLARGADRTRAIGVIGTGEIGRRVVASLTRVGWVRPVLYNRTPAPGVLPLGALGDHEGVVVCTAGPAHWLPRPPGARWVVDLGVPAQVDGAAIGLDELLGGEGQRLEPAVRARAEAAVHEAALGVAEAFRHHALRRGLTHANTLRDRFLRESLGACVAEALRDLDAEQQRRVVRATEAAIRRYNHQLLTWLRAGALEGT